VLLDKALSVVERVPTVGGAEEPAWKNCWNWNLCDAAYGSLVLDVKEGRVSAELKSQGFNYAYRRTATPTTAATPNSATSSLPTTQPNASTKPSTTDKPIPPHMANRSDASTPPAKEPAKDTPPKVNGAPSPAASNDKADKEKQKRKEKKERKERERAEREAKETEEGKDNAAPPPAAEPATPAQAPKSGKATPTSNPPEASTSAADLDVELKSPATESTGGARTPTSRRGQKNPWTIFMRMSVPATEGELRDFFGEAKAGIIRVNFPQAYPGRAKIAYVEFGDEEAMRAGLEKHAEKLKDTVPEVKQATPPEERHAGGPRGGPPGRGRGGRGGFAARGFAAAGLTKGAKANGESSSPAAPAPSGDN